MGFLQAAAESLKFGQGQIAVQQKPLQLQTGADFSIDGGISLEPGRVDQITENRMAAALMEMSGNDQTIAAVISRADEDQGKGVCR